MKKQFSIVRKVEHTHQGKINQYIAIDERTESIPISDEESWKHNGEQRKQIMEYKYYDCIFY